MGVENPGAFESEKAFEEARTFFENKKFSSALEIFSSLVDQNPQNSEFIAWLGRTQYVNGDKKTALELANKAIELDNKSFLAYYVKGLSLSDIDKDLALANFDKSIELKPDFPNAYIWRGDIYSAQKKYQNAINNYSKALDLSPNNTDAFLGRSEAYMEIGEDRKAVLDLTRVNSKKEDIFEFQGNANDTEAKGLVEKFNKHLKEVILPQINESKENLIGSWLTIFEWGTGTEYRISDGNSYKFLDATRGAGLISLTDKNIYISIFSDLSKSMIPKKGVASILLSLFTRVWDSSKIVEKDMEIKISHSSVQGSSLDPEFNRLSLKSSEFACNIYSSEKIMIRAIEMGRQGRLENILEEEYSNNEILGLIGKLADLQKVGAVSQQEFESKKKELLARL